MNFQVGVVYYCAPKGVHVKVLADEGDKVRTTHGVFLKRNPLTGADTLQPVEAGTVTTPVGGVHVLTCICTHCRNFQKFHKENPHVYLKLVELARLVLSRGRRKYAIEGLWQQLRWHYDFEVENSSGLEEGTAGSNQHRTRYARLIMAQEADLLDFFDTKAMKCE